MEFWIVIEEDYGEVYVHPFNCLEMARNYVDEYCTENVKIERHIMNLGWQGKEQLSNGQATVKQRSSKIKTYKNAVVKFNSGAGALLCNGCSIILAYGFRHKDVEHYCKDCEKESNKDKKTV